MECQVSRLQDEIAELQERLEAAELDKLRLQERLDESKSESARWEKECREWLERTMAAHEENKRLRAALSNLYDYQNGCPLPKYEKGWGEAMSEARALLGYGDSR